MLWILIIFLFAILTPHNLLICVLYRNVQEIPSMVNYAYENYIKRYQIFSF